jgi:hypothetical protein
MNTQQTPHPSTSGATKPGMSSGQASERSESVTAALRTKANEAAGRAADMAQQAGEQARKTASTLAADANERTKSFLNQRVSTGADLAGHVAESARCAAANLDPQAPQLAEFVRGAAGRVDEFSERMRGKTVDELLRDASDFTRRQPALVFGLASLAGFFLFRVLKANPETATPLVQSSRHAGHSYG